MKEIAFLNDEISGWLDFRNDIFYFEDEKYVPFIFKRYIFMCPLNDYMHAFIFGDEKVSAVLDGLHACYIKTVPDKNQPTEIKQLLDFPIAYSNDGTRTNKECNVSFAIVNRTVTIRNGDWYMDDSAIHDSPIVFYFTGWRFSRKTSLLEEHIYHNITNLQPSMHLADLCSVM